MKLRGKTGRPTLEVDQPELLKAIVDIALHGSAAHEKRRSDVYRSIRTLDELVEELKKDFAVSRSAVYTRLLPKRRSSLEGKRHITTVPVKLIRAQNELHSKHPDMYFCTANINRLEEIASLLGPDHVFFLSQDDKAKVPIGLTAANKQSPLIMHVEYRVSLPDHDFVIAGQHKLCPSVYAGIEIKKEAQANQTQSLIQALRTSPFGLVNIRHQMLMGMVLISSDYSIWTSSQLFQRPKKSW